MMSPNEQNSYYARLMRQMRAEDERRALVIEAYKYHKDKHAEIVRSKPSND